MSAYTKTTNFAAKDALTTGDPNKIVNIATSVNSKADKATPTFSGTVTTPALVVTGTATIGTIDGGTY